MMIIKLLNAKNKKKVVIIPSSLPTEWNKFIRSIKHFHQCFNNQNLPCDHKHTNCAYHASRIPKANIILLISSQMSALGPWIIQCYCAWNYSILLNVKFLNAIVHEMIQCYCSFTALGAHRVQTVIFRARGVYSSTAARTTSRTVSPTSSSRRWASPVVSIQTTPVLRSVHASRTRPAPLRYSSRPRLRQVSRSRPFSFRFGWKLNVCILDEAF